MLNCGKIVTRDQTPSNISLKKKMEGGISLLRRKSSIVSMRSHLVFDPTFLFPFVFEI